MEADPLAAFAPPKLGLVLAVFCLSIATGLAGVLAWHALYGQPQAPLGCGGAADCLSVTASRWAYLGPIPVTLPATALYGAMAGGLLLLETLRAARMFSSVRGVWAGLMTLSFVAIGAALWFAALQVFVLRRFCPYCLATHACALLGSIFVLVMARGNQRNQRMLPGNWFVPAMVSGGVLALLIGGQWWLLRALPAATIPATTPTPVNSFALVPGEIALANGRVRLDASAYPALGSPTAQHVVAVMFDYTCETCRAEHALLAGALARYGNQLTILLVPTPLDPACNVAVERLRPEHANACLYARCALAVWKAAPEKFAAYDAWLMANGDNTQPPPIDAARRQAEAMVGKAAFGQTLARQEIEQSLRAAGQMYQSLEAGVIPKLLLPDEVVAGGFTSSAQLSQMLERKLGVKPVQSLNGE